MARSGFCSNEEIIKSIKNRFKKAVFFLVTPELLFLEEFIMFLEESSAMDGLSTAFIMQTGKQKYYELTMFERMRYINLAKKMNSWAFVDQTTLN
ncbi:hypothetical protein KR059_008834 [Drosophila kikkawai]|nr:hypothetical protein KR059_008834 [Drosophila kikkawai]